MPRWPEQDGLAVERLDGFTVSGGGLTFTLSFPAAPVAAGETATLAFDGMATAYEVALNGAPILRGGSMFEAHAVDVTALLREGANELVIRCVAEDELLAAQPKRPRQRWRTRVVENGGALRFVRTSVLGR